MSSQPLEHYTDSDRTDHEIALQVLYSTLKGRSYENRISGKELAELVPVKRTTCYDLIKELRDDWGLAVYSRQGYFEIQDPAMLDDIIESINRTIAEKERTKRNLAKSFNQGRI